MAKSKGNGSVSFETLRKDLAKLCADLRNTALAKKLKRKMGQTLVVVAILIIAVTLPKIAVLVGCAALILFAIKYLA